MAGHGVNLSTAVTHWNEYPANADYSYVNPDRAVGEHQEADPDGCCWAQSALPGQLGTRVSSPASHCYSLPVSTLYASCNLPLWAGAPLCSGTGPEGKAGASYRREERL